MQYSNNYFLYFAIYLKRFFYMKPFFSLSDWQYYVLWLQIKKKLPFTVFLITEYEGFRIINTTNTLPFMISSKVPFFMWIKISVARGEFILSKTCQRYKIIPLCRRFFLNSKINWSRTNSLYIFKHIFQFKQKKKIPFISFNFFKYLINKTY